MAISKVPSPAAPVAPAPVSPKTAGKDDRPERRLLGRRQRITLAALAVAIAVCLGFAWASRNAVGHLSFLRSRGAAELSGGKKPIVDLNPWLTAQALTPLAVSAEEKEDAREAERLADHEVDQAFATALRLAAAKHKPLSAEAKALTARVQQLQQVVKEDQARLTSLSGSVGGGASGSAAVATKKDAAGAAGAAGATGAVGDDDVEVAKAQLGLDTDDLNDAQQDLARAVDDESVRIQQELTAHEALMKKYDQRAGDLGELAVISTQRNGSLASRIQAWFAQRTRWKLLLEAEAEASDDAKTLTASHNALEAKMDAAAANPASGASTAADRTSAAAERVKELKAKAALRQLLTIYDDRIQTQQQLSGVYAKWAAQVVVQHRIVMHLMLQSLAELGAIAFCVVLVDALIAFWMERPSAEVLDADTAGGRDPRRRHTLQTILQVVVQTMGVIVGLVVVFGRPEQISTILGLATAGLTVALQSYIVAFCGWFVLMGKNGIRVGDSVEINSVGGEVLEIGLFRTTLLETGNWTATGHPTGRRVAFMNTFAVTGQYFNFSTVGQWMWDEIKVNVPETEETYAVIETIHTAVLKETKEDAKRAEAEWKGAGRETGLSQFSAAPTVNLRPGASGVDIVVRYVTRAAHRFETRNCLYQAVLDVMHQPVEGGGAEAGKAS